MDADKEHEQAILATSDEETENVEALPEKEELIVTKYDEPSHSQQILALLERDTQYCDVTIEAEGETVKVHKTLFGVYSDFFNKAFNTEMKEKYDNVVKLEGVRAEVMKSIVGFFYSGKIDISSKNAIDLLAAADYLMIDKIKRFSINYLCKNINASDCFHLWECGKKYEEEKLVENSLVFIGTHLKEILEKDEAEHFNTEEFGEILATSKPFRKSEEETYQVILSWIRENLDSRQEKLLTLLKNLDLCQLSTEFFFEAVLHEQLVRRSIDTMAVVADELARRNNQLIAEKEETAEEQRGLKRKLTEKNNEQKFLLATNENSSIYKFSINTGKWKQLEQSIHSLPRTYLNSENEEDPVVCPNYVGIVQGEHLFKIRSSSGEKFTKGIVCSSKKKEDCNIDLSCVDGTIYAVETGQTTYWITGDRWNRDTCTPRVFRYDERLEHWTKVSVENQSVCYSQIRKVFTAS